jgi:hypothetical protein
MDIIPKTPWKERRIKSGSFLDRKLSADILKIRRAHNSNIREIEKRTEYSAFMVAVCLLGALVLMVVCCRSCHAQEINLDIISVIESSGNNMAYNFKSGATGQYQITKSCLNDYNKHAAENRLTLLNLTDMYEPKYAYMVSNWYLNEHIPDLLWDYNIPDTITSRLIAYNWGIGNLKKWFKRGCHWNKLPLETRHYIQRYFKELKGDD